MRKSSYYFFTKMFWLDTLQYKFNFCVSFFADLLPLSVYILIWYYIFLSQGKEEIGGYTLLGMTSYYIFATLLNYSIFQFAPLALMGQIKDGSFSQLLTRPFNILWAYLCYDFAEFFVYLIINSSFLAIIFLFFPQYAFIPSMVQLSCFALFLVLGLIMAYWLRMLFGLSAFWLTESSRLLSIIENLLQFLAGGFIPLTLFPDFFQKIAAWLPFQYLIFFPIRVIQGKETPASILFGLGVLFFWTVFFCALTSYLFKKGIKQYEAVGN